MERVILGTGLIGSGLAMGALSRGESVKVWNRTRAKAESTGAVVCDTIAAAVSGASVVHVVLTADAAVDAVLSQVYAANPSVLVLDHSTCSAARTGDRGTRLQAEGFRYLHCPVFMNPTHCREAGGAMLVSGPAAWFEEVRHRLEPMTGRVQYLGEGFDQAAATKLVGNAMIVATVGVLAEVYQLAESMGVGAEAAHALVSQVSPANVVKGRGKRMLDRDFSPHWSLTMARKDLGLMLEAEAGLPMLQALAGRMDAAVAEGHGDRDLAVIRDAGSPR